AHHVVQRYQRETEREASGCKQPQAASQAAMVGFHDQCEGASPSATRPHALPSPLTSQHADRDETDVEGKREQSEPDSRAANPALAIFLVQRRDHELLHFRSDLEAV